MSKKSRELARQGKQKTSLPRGIIVIGIVAVIAVGIVAGRMLAGPTGAASADGVAAAQLAGPATPANGAVNVAANAAAPGKKLLFFMNPDGYPCQTQLGILNGVADSLSKVAQVVYIKTTVPADLQKFEDYGIRGLPSLVIADRDGRELSRFSPGIQSADAVLAALTK
ncbi:MAG: TlpA family protein disulfide reductase [Gemmatimonadaceae bacterium]